jgi:hypothetical protein
LLGALESIDAQTDNQRLLQVDWQSTLKDAEAASSFLEQIFIRS